MLKRGFSHFHALSLKAAFPLVQQAADAAAAQSQMDEAAALEQQGKLKEARDLYHEAADKAAAAGDQLGRAEGLSAAAVTSISLGDYAGAISDAEQAVKLRQALGENTRMGWDFNTIGLADYHLGNYAGALEHYQEALKFDRAQADMMGEVTRLNNIGNIYFYQGRYAPALENYEEALKVVNAAHSPQWESWGKKLTTGNIAALYLQLGLDERALELYQHSAGRPEEMQVAEYAQLLLNEGVLYRRMGDPIKALQVYQAAQALFRKAHHSDGEMRALRLIGIARAMDLGDLRSAVKAFSAALELSQKSSNNIGLVQASLYLGDVLRRLHDYKEATKHLDLALESAQKAGLIENQWKTLYALGQIAEQTETPETAREDYRKAISLIESVRAGLRVASLKSDFLADKRDVYDSLIELEMRQPAPAVEEIFQWMERSRARTLLDQMAVRTRLSDFSLQLVKSHLPQDAVLVEFWMGPQSGAAVWITSDGQGMVRYPAADDIRTGITNLMAAVQAPGNGWRDVSRDLGAKILTVIPLRRHVIIVPDGPLNIPFEVLSIPGQSGLLIEQSDVSYLPSARMVALLAASKRSWLFPWNREMVAMGDPPVSSTDALAGKEQWQPLPASADEVRSIAKIIRGKAEIHLGADARKAYLLDHRLEGLPLLHLSTHALVDIEQPSRSRILLASDSPNVADDLFLDEVNNLDLKGVGLVTVSACDTARGKMVAGEGLQAFSQSFLAAGASATITSMWRVADGPTASFMDEVYYALRQGYTKAEALRRAKLQFLHSNSTLSSPRAWAAFVLNGDGWNPTTLVISWSMVLFVLAAVLAAISLVLWRVMVSRSKTKVAVAQNKNL